jgi:hypothetical protein
MCCALAGKRTGCSGRRLVLLLKQLQLEDDVEKTQVQLPWVIAPRNKENDSQCINRGRINNTKQFLQAVWTKTNQLEKVSWYIKSELGFQTGYGE